ncbi:biotin synthase BioB [Zhenpiania hominis]|uniref:Biotin synthase n=1 Tax=Zhenpiania hominis TaxID=2763644 RepID=A0A923SSD5_9FIRM|nr:biotin synthase BioB [Zhenpiania hominis]MBC6680264.1 biotin synthase BioB [Zhenpiania hominis]
MTKRLWEAVETLRNGRLLSAEELNLLAEEPLLQLRQAADSLREIFCGNAFDLCAIINGKSGSCSEDCKYCAQSACYRAEIREYPLLPEEKIMQEAAYHADKGVMRFSVVTSGKRLSETELKILCKTYRRIATKGNLSLCASLGLLSEAQFRRLREAGVSRCHNNLETSESFFPKICTTHRFKDKVRSIQAAQRAGLEVCSGGIIGMGETMKDRIDLALALRNLGIRSVPLNLLNPIPGTPLEHQKPLLPEEVDRTVAIFRFALPDAAIRLAGGRGLLPDRGESAFRSGANAAITGDMLTTGGIGIEADQAMIKKLGFKVVKK